MLCEYHWALKVCVLGLGHKVWYDITINMWPKIKQSAGHACIFTFYMFRTAAHCFCGDKSEDEFCSSTHMDSGIDYT